MKILLIEDEKTLSGSIKKGLEQQNYVVDVCNDGMEGYDIASEGAYDLLLLDLMLPNMDGIEICTNLRKNGIKKPIIILTAKSQLEDVVNGLNCGADDYISKPFDFDELLARIKAQLRRPIELIQEELKCGVLTLNTKYFSVKVKSKEIFISKKEFQILEYLIKNKRRVVTKEDILASLWEYDTDVTTNTVEKHVASLRQKIVPYDFLIKTIRGYGYKIIE